MVSNPKCKPQILKPRLCYPPSTGANCKLKDKNVMSGTISNHMGVSKNRGTLFWGSLWSGSCYLGYCIRAPYSRKLPYCCWYVFLFRPKGSECNSLGLDVCRGSLRGCISCGREWVQPGRLTATWLLFGLAWTRKQHLLVSGCVRGFLIDEGSFYLGSTSGPSFLSETSFWGFYGFI